MKNWLRRYPFVWIAPLLILLDQASKAWIQAIYVSDFWIIPNWLSFTLIYNDGVAWNFLAGQRWLLVLISIVSSVIFFVWYLRCDWKPQKLALITIVAGAVGNLIDRMAVGLVVDFIDWQFLDIIVLGRNFPIFNVADICVVLGTIGLFISFFFEKEEHHG